jgi:hypothetical protein
MHLFDCAMKNWNFGSIFWLNRQEFPRSAFVKVGAGYFGYNFYFSRFQSSVQLFIVWATRTCLHRMVGRAGTPEHITPPDPAPTCAPGLRTAVCTPRLQLVHAYVHGTVASARWTRAASSCPGGCRAVDHVASADTRPAPSPRVAAAWQLAAPARPAHELDSSGIATSRVPLINMPAWLSWPFRRACFCQSPLMHRRGAPPSACLHWPHVSPHDPIAPSPVIRPPSTLPSSSEQERRRPSDPPSR